MVYHETSLWAQPLKKCIYFLRVVKFYIRRNQLELYNLREWRPSVGPAKYLHAHCVVTACIEKIVELDWSISPKYCTNGKCGLFLGHMSDTVIPFPTYFVAKLLVMSTSRVYSAFANSCPLQTGTFLFPLIHNHNVILSSNKF